MRGLSRFKVGYQGPEKDQVWVSGVNYEFCLILILGYARKG